MLRGLPRDRMPGTRSATIPRRMLAVAFHLALAGLPPQDPAPKPPAPPPSAAPQAAPAAPAPALVVPWDEKTTKAALDEFGKTLKGTPSMAEKSRALEALSGGSNKLMVKPLAQLVENDKSVVLRRRAAELLGNQPAAEANGAIRKLLKSPRVESHPGVMAELIKNLSKCGYDKAQWSDIDDLFERQYHTERVPIQEAILELVIARQEKQALPLLLRNVDEPIPENVDHKDNPPAEYWEARWKSWNVWRNKVKEALFAVTGQRFSTAAEAQAWLKKNPIK